MKSCEITEAHVDEMFLLYGKQMSHRAIGRHFGLSKSAVQRAMKNRSNGEVIGAASTKSGPSINNVKLELKAARRELFIASAKVDFLLNSLMHNSYNQASELVRRSPCIGPDKEYQLWADSDDLVFSEQFQTIRDYQKAAGLM